MSTHADLQQLQHESSGTARPGAGRFGAQSRRVFEDLKVLGGIALAETGAAARELRVQGARGWSVGLVRAHPLTSVLVALGIGLALGYVLYRH